MRHTSTEQKCPGVRTDLILGYEKLLNSLRKQKSGHTGPM